MSERHASAPRATSPTHAPLRPPPPPSSEAELLSACAVTAAPAPGVAALMTSALDAASELGQTATGTRAALADISAALQAHKASLTASKGSSPGPVVVQTPDGESHSLTSPSQAQAVLEAASAAAQAAAADATAAKEACAAGAQEEAALEAEIAELEARAAALRRAAEERAASEASPSQQALSVQAWYKDTAATLAQFTGVEVTSVSAQVGGQCLAALQLAGLPGVSLEVQYTPLSDPGAGAGEAAQAPRVALHDIIVQGSVGVPPAEVEAARAEALRCGDLQVLLTALRGGGAA